MLIISSQSLFMVRDMKLSAGRGGVASENAP